MKSLLTDPIVWICFVVLIAGVFGLVWAIKKFRSLSGSRLDDTTLFQEDTAPAPIIPDLPLRASPAIPAVSSAPAVSREVADRLESMTQRLAEMQNVLLKQSNSATPAANVAGGVGQGFSPETLEKLLKIVGNVIQQVDILQKSLNSTK